MTGNDNSNSPQYRGNGTRTWSCLLLLLLLLLGGRVVHAASCFPYFAWCLVICDVGIKSPKQLVYAKNLRGLKCT